MVGLARRFRLSWVSPSRLKPMRRGGGRWVPAQAETRGWWEIRGAGVGDGIAMPCGAALQSLVQP